MGLIFIHTIDVVSLKNENKLRICTVYISFYAMLESEPMPKRALADPKTFEGVSLMNDSALARVNAAKDQLIDQSMDNRFEGVSTGVLHAVKLVNLARCR